MKNERPIEEVFDKMQLIKDGLQNKHKGIYTLIVRNFESEIKELGISLFAFALADKLKTERDKINLASLRSAWFRRNSASKKYTSSNNEENILHRDIDMDKLDWH